MKYKHGFHWVGAVKIWKSRDIKTANFVRCEKLPVVKGRAPKVDILKSRITT